MNLRALLALDALTCLLMAGVLLGLPGLVAAFTGLPGTLTTSAGAVLILIALMMGWLAFVRRPPTWGIALVIALNVAWALGCVTVSLIGNPAPAGVVLLLVQAVAVAGFAWLEWLYGFGSRRLSL